MRYEILYQIYFQLCFIFVFGCQLCSLRPPFHGDSYASLKKAIVCGRYQPIPRKYSDTLGKIIGMMLRVHAKERPTAAMLLCYPDIVSKLHLDSGPTSAKSRQDQQLSLMETIKLPGNVRNLHVVLPKPCYPDLRPNSPSVWTVQEQRRSYLAREKRPIISVPVMDNKADVDVKDVENKSDVANIVSQINAEVISVQKDPIPIESVEKKVSEPRRPEMIERSRQQRNRPSVSRLSAISNSSKATPTAPSVVKPLGLPSRPSIRDHRLW